MPRRMHETYGAVRGSANHETAREITKSVNEL
jgi:hypothetical protein